METQSVNEVQTRNPLMSMSAKQKKRLSRMAAARGPSTAASPTSPVPDPLTESASSTAKVRRGERRPESLERPLDQATLFSAWGSSSAPSTPSPLSSAAHYSASNVPASSTSSSPYTPPQQNNASSSTSPPGSTISAASSSTTSPSNAAASSLSPTLPPSKLNKASSWMNRLAGTGELRRANTEGSVSPRSPRLGNLGGSAGNLMSATSSSASTSTSSSSSPLTRDSAQSSSSRSLASRPLSPSTSPRSAESGSTQEPGAGKGAGGEDKERPADEEEEKRKKRFFNNLIFFKDVESVRGSNAGTFEASGTTDASSGSSRKESKKKVMVADDSSGSDARPKGLRKVTSGRQMTDSLLKATRTLSSGTGSGNLTSTKNGKKRRSDVIEEMVAAERGYLARLNMLLTVKWFFGRFMLAIYDEVHLRPIIENILGQFESYLKMHADFLGALNEKLKQSWDNSVTPIGDLLIDKMGFLQCYCDFYSENTEQWHKIEEAARMSYAFGLFLQEMERKPELEYNSVQSLFVSPIKHLAGYVTLLKDLMEVTSIHHPDYAATRKAYFQAKVIVGSMQKESMLLP